MSEMRSFVPTFCDLEIDAQVSPGWTVYVLPERQTVLAGAVVVLRNKVSVYQYRAEAKHPSPPTHRYTPSLGSSNCMISRKFVEERRSRRQHWDRIQLEIEEPVSRVAENTRNIVGKLVGRSVGCLL